MSLFGTTPPEDSPSMNSSFARSRHGLFEDEPGSRSNADSLFDDESPSPWDISSRKQRSRTELLRNLLPTSDVPPVYASVFEAALRDGNSEGNAVAAGSVARTLAAAKLSADDQAKIMNIIAPEGSGDIALNHNEFNVLLGLIGLAQEGEIVSLDGLDERRKDLPSLNLPGVIVATPAVSPSRLKTATYPASKAATIPTTAAPMPPSPLAASKVSMEYHDDPWNSPDLHKNHRHAALGSGTTPLPDTHGQANTAIGSIASDSEPTRTTSNFTTTSATTIDSVGGSTLGESVEVGRQSATAGWDAFGAGHATIDNAGFAAIPSSSALNGDSDSIRPVVARQLPRAIGSGRTGGAVEENIIVALMPEKEGLFFFQHHNYEVTSTRRGTKVIRRYSDFVWLLECLDKRYPFRVLPLLPPKRVAVNGNHLSNDGAFIEKRRRGLARFLNALARHPILGAEQLVVMFMTVPTELSVWRKQATISVQDEFDGRPLPAGLEESLSPQLQDLFDRTRSGVRRSAELYITTCNIMDRLVKRGQGVANDHARLALSLQSLAEASADTYATDTNDVPLLNDGLGAMSKHLRMGQTLMDDEARAWDEGVLEDLKRQRDALVGLRNLFDRRDRLDRDNIPQLERRIQNNEAKLATLRNKDERLVKPGEIDKVVENIIKDKESIVHQHNRSVFVKECIRDELIYFQSTQYHISHWNQDWAQERVKYSEMLADNWRRLLDELDGMPLGD